jgi:hypothetical protein
MTTPEPTVDRPSPRTSAMGTISIHDATAPVACTASRDEIRSRIEQLGRMRAAMTRLERTPHGLLLHFPDRPNLGAELHTFVVDEKRCCQFWGFAIDTADGELTLRWDGPPDTIELIDRLYAFFEGDEPLTADSGLL